MSTTKSKPVFTRAEIKILDWAIEQAASWAGGIPDPDHRERHRDRIAHAKTVLGKAKGLRHEG
jgi:hypothetical protein